MKVEDGIAELTADEYVKLLCRLLGGEDFEMNSVSHANDDTDDRTVTKIQWGITTDADRQEIYRRARASGEVQHRLEHLLDTTASGHFVDLLNEQAGDEAHIHEQMALDTDDEVAKARRQGIATGLRMAQAMALEIHNDL